MAGQQDGGARNGALSGVARVETIADLARLLRQLRRRDARQRGQSELTYRELAAKAGWSQAAVGEYFTGKTLPPTDRFDNLIGMLGATPAEQGMLATLRDRVEEMRRAGPDTVPAARGSDAVPAGRGLPVPRQLPGDLSGFAGRSTELARLDNLLAESRLTSAAAVWIVSGSAGVGKTALAVHWGHRVEAKFPDGQLYIDLRGYDPAGPTLASGEAVCAFLEAFGIAAQQIPADRWAQAALYRSVLASRRMLVILDNARDAEQIRPLLPGAPGCLALITSRNPLFALVAKEGAQPLALNPMATAEARQLLEHRLGRQRTAAQAGAVDAIIAHCSGLPLALAMVAARAATHPAATLDVLAAELREASPGLAPFEDVGSGTGVRTVFSGSYRTVGDRAGRIFRILGEHPGPDITPPAAASLLGIPIRELGGPLNELTRTHLVCEHLPRRYAFHDLLRGYANELAAVTDSEAERGAALQRVLDHYLYTAHAAGTLLFPHREPATLPPASVGTVPEHLATAEHALTWLVAERATVLSAVRRAADVHLDAHAWRLAGAMADFLHRQGHWHDHVATQRIALSCARRLGDRAAEADCHRELARAWTRLGRYDDAHTALHQALALFGGLGDRAGQARTHHSFGWLLGLQGRHGEALGHERQALALFGATGQRHGEASALNTLGWCQSQLGDHQEALRSCLRAAGLQRKHGDRWGLVNTLDSLGFIHDRLGQPRQAVACYQEAIDLSRDLGDRFNEAAAMIKVGDVHRSTGRPRAARAAWERAVMILDELGHPDADLVHAKLRDQD